MNPERCHCKECKTTAGESVPMKPVIEKIIELVMDARRRGVKIDKYAVTADMYRELLICVSGDRRSMFSKPSPPIKSIVKSYNGIFGYSESVEYDHSAPEYLRQVDEYNERVEIEMKRSINSNSLTINIPGGPVEVYCGA